ncbi:MAG: hypothetical protein MUC38_11630 [Cyclobacteriaceae bacterium]|jgi:antitoxin component YwqK of YwqJK toxin-antitoxin module|nr:hypothetical protein [Cyclobacteriaceae bacterium]
MDRSSHHFYGLRNALPTGALALAWLLVAAYPSRAQITRYTYHDQDKKSIKERYQVKDTVSNSYHGRYISYFVNGNIESKGQFVDNETTGVWEFFYETGNLKMRGVLRQNANYGLWEYFYESGQKSMEGSINGKVREGMWKIFYESGKLKETGSYAEGKRQGIWKTFFEDGVLRGEIEYNQDHGRYIEYDHDGKVIGEGPRVGPRNAGHWRLYTNGVLSGEGDYMSGKKEGIWKYYFPSGKVSSEGAYKNDEPEGDWTYYFDDGHVSARGAYVGGQKNGYWTSLHPGGQKKSETTYVNGVGQYKEYHPNGKLRMQGMIKNGKNDGKWEYFFEDGKKEGECEYADGKGTFFGYYPSGTLQTKGQMEDDRRVGTWELYEHDGKLSGYYKPIYENGALARQITALVNRPQPVSKSKRTPNTGFGYFRSIPSEYRGVILSANPAMTFLGSLPLGFEFYNEERLGHEFEFEGIRDPFFETDTRVAQNRLFQRGYAIALKQKFYNPLRTGMWYFAHEVRFTNIGHFANVEFAGVPGSLITASASEQRAEYGILLGGRLMRRNDGDGFTIDAYVGYALGYRSFDSEPIYRETFEAINQQKLSQTFRFGLNFGYSLSFDGRGRR